MIVKIHGKKYRWRPEKMHGALLGALYIAGVFAAAFGTWAAAILLVTMGGPKC